MRDSTLSRRVLLPAAALLSAWPSEILQAAEPPPRPFLITGASGGIGRASARALSGSARFVLCGARTAAAAQEVAAAQGAGSLGGYGLALNADLEQSDLQSVQTYVGQLSRDLPGGVEGALLCAGVEGLPLRRTPQGVESTFGINTLSHFVIAVELAARAVQERRALRLVSVTSSAAFDSRLGSGDALDLSWERRPYDARQAYVDSKACNILLADELQRRLSPHPSGMQRRPGTHGQHARALHAASARRAARRKAKSSSQAGTHTRAARPRKHAASSVPSLPHLRPRGALLGRRLPPDASPPRHDRQPLPWRNDALAAAVWQGALRCQKWLSRWPGGS